jgi:8-oxo-dGTP pyrophosphatase MutT (NUDIX family)
MIRAAGILIVDTEGKALFVKRGPGGDYPGLWAFPGGRLEDGETARDAAVRETKEEAGFKAPAKELTLWTRRVAAREVANNVDTALAQPVAHAPGLPGEATVQPGGEQVDFTTFLLSGVEPFTPELGPKDAPEHVAFAWAPPDQPPEPLHPGARIALARFGMDELGVARAIAAGELTSPQRYGKFWLFDIRITGTGASYRPTLKEYVWRDASLYLHDEFLARCNGLPVIWEHPAEKPALDSEEFHDRIIGTVFLPHIRGSDVWGVAKVWDDAAAEMMESEALSTSPGVVFGPASGNQELKLKDGSTLLIEGKPALPDHIAVVTAGVWDKGGAPSGVSSAEVTMAEEAKKTEERVDAAAVMDALSKLSGRIDSMHGRLDAIDKARKDASDKEEERLQKEREKEEHLEGAKKDAARLDAARKDRFGHRKDGESEEDYKKRHDADEMAVCDALEKGGTEKEKAKTDARKARHDAETEEERERKERDDKAKHDKIRHDAALATENAELKAKLAAIGTDVTALRDTVTSLTRETPIEERDALAKAQARADGIAAMFGHQVSAPITGETSLAYRKRLLAGFLRHSPRLKDAKLDAADGPLLATIEDVIYADAAEAARRADGATTGVLIPHVERDSAGRQITRFTGDPLAWMAPHMTGGQVGRIIRSPNHVD